MKTELVNEMTINDKNGSKIGTFTGTVCYTNDLQKVSSVIGGAEFINSKLAKAVKLCNLKVDISSLTNKIFCLYFDGNR